MSLTKTDLKILAKMFEKNNRELMTFMFQHFATKEELRQTVHEEVAKEVEDIRQNINLINDTLAGIIYRLDVAQLPAIENRLEEHEQKIKVIQTRLRIK